MWLAATPGKAAPQEEHPPHLRLLSDTHPWTLHPQASHTEVKAFSCPVEGCGRRFAIKEYLDVHRKTHEKERSFPCMSCSKVGQT